MGLGKKLADKITDAIVGKASNDTSSKAVDAELREITDPNKKQKGFVS
jgi:hypothetical protein